MKPHAETLPREPHAGRKRRCGAHGRQQNRPCRHPAGFRTNHPGVGKCFLHGGLTPIKHGRYSGVIRALTKERHAELYEEIRAEDERLQESLFDEIALLRTILAILPDVWPNETPLDKQQQMASATQLVDAIGKTVLRNAQVGYAMGQRISSKDWEAFHDHLFRVIAVHIGDPQILLRIGQVLRDTIPSTDEPRAHSLTASR